MRQSASRRRETWIADTADALAWIARFEPERDAWLRLTGRLDIIQQGQPLPIISTTEVFDP